MTKIDDGGSAFPLSTVTTCDGMTLRQYAAIKLCIPDSGTDWLDDMIRKAQRDRFAGQALANRYSQDASNEKLVAKWAYQVADAMLEARSK